MNDRPVTEAPALRAFDTAAMVTMFAHEFVVIHRRAVALSETVERSDADRQKLRLSLEEAQRDRDLAQAALAESRMVIDRLRAELTQAKARLQNP